MPLYRCDYFTHNKKTNLTEIPEFYPTSRGIVNKDYLGNLPFYWIVWEAKTKEDAIEKTIEKVEELLCEAEIDDEA